MKNIIVQNNKVDDKFFPFGQTLLLFFFLVRFCYKWLLVVVVTVAAAAIWTIWLTKNRNTSVKMIINDGNNDDDDDGNKRSHLFFFHLCEYTVQMNGQKQRSPCMLLTVIPKWGKERFGVKIINRDIFMLKWHSSKKLTKISNQIQCIIIIKLWITKSWRSIL